MFGKVKKWLGIEGVKLELVLPEFVHKSDGEINGQIRFFSMNTQTVTNIRVKLIERYTRGKKEDKLIDEYNLGEIYLAQEIEVPANEPIEIDFSLPFELMKSEMDEIEDNSMVLGGLVKAAKWLRSVKSEYRLEATAKVRGVALDPFDRHGVIMK